MGKRYTCYRFLFFPRLPPIKSFPALSPVVLFFPRLQCFPALAHFPVLATNPTRFSRTRHQWHAFLALPIDLTFSRLITFVCLFVCFRFFFSVENCCYGNSENKELDIQRSSSSSLNAKTRMLSYLIVVGIKLLNG